MILLHLCDTMIVHTLLWVYTLNECLLETNCHDEPLPKFFLIYPKALVSLISIIMLNKRLWTNTKLIIILYIFWGGVISLIIFVLREVLKWNDMILQFSLPQIRNCGQEMALVMQTMHAQRWQYSDRVDKRLFSSIENVHR